MQANEGRLGTVTENGSPNKIADIVDSQWHRIQGVGEIELSKDEGNNFVLCNLALHQITVKGAIASVHVFAANMALVVNASALSNVPGIIRRSEREAEPLLFYLVNKGFQLSR